MRGGKRTRSGMLASPLRVSVDLRLSGLRPVTIQIDSHQSAGFACHGNAAMAQRIANSAAAISAINSHLASSDRLEMDHDGIHVIIQMEGEEQAEIGFQHAWALVTTIASFAVL